MEKLKNDEKAKHANRPDYYSQGCAFSIIGLMFLLLTIMTSYKTFNVLPVPLVFYYGSIVVGMLLFGLSVIVASAWRVIPIPLKYVLIIAILPLCVLCLLYRYLFFIGTIGSVLFVIVPALVMVYLNVGIFPLLLIVTVVVAILCQRMSITIFPRLMQFTTNFMILFAAIYIWGQAVWYVHHYYDEYFTAANSTYHSILVYGAGSDPSYISLYECQYRIFSCTLVYQSDYDYYRKYDASETQLIFDEESSILRLEYHPSERNTQYSDIPPILYEHPIQQE